MFIFDFLMLNRTSSKLHLRFDKTYVGYMKKNRCSLERLSVNTYFWIENLI